MDCIVHILYMALYIVYVTWTISYKMRKIRQNKENTHEYAFCTKIRIETTHAA